MDIIDEGERNKLWNTKNLLTLARMSKNMIVNSNRISQTMNSRSSVKIIQLYKLILIQKFNKFNKCDWSAMEKTSQQI